MTSTDDSDRRGVDIQLRAVLEQLPTAVVMIQAPGGRLLFANGQAVALSNKTSPAPHEGDATLAFGSEGFPADDWPLVRALATNESANDQEIIVESTDGNELSLLMNAAPLRDADGTTMAVVGTFLDITQRKHSDRKLAEDRLLAATATAERAEAVAIEANRAKDDFIAVVSHELRTPLNTIRLWARMLRNEKLSAKDREDGIQMVERAAVAQQQVIDDLFDVSRIASGKLRLSMRMTRLADAIRGAVDAVEPVATARGIRLTADVSSDIGTVRADPGRIQQVVWNLLSNAVKFTPAGGKVQVAARRADGNVVIEVSDTGIGIAPDFLEKVFERFRQAENGAKRAHGGLGLGLAIAKQLVELHEGTITATSEGLGKGTTFRVTLPLAPQAGLADAPAESSGTGSELRGVDILVVEDEGMTRDTMCRLLENAAAKVRAVGSVAAAREALDRRMPQLLVSDIGMPGEDGYALIRHLRSLPKTSHVITIAVTAFARPEDRRQLLEAGFDEHLAKPLDADQLLATLARLVQRSPNA